MIGLPAEDPGTTDTAAVQQPALPTQYQPDLRCTYAASKPKPETGSAALVPGLVRYLADLFVKGCLDQISLDLSPKNDNKSISLSRFSDTIRSNLDTYCPEKMQIVRLRKFVSSSFQRMARHTLSCFVCNRDGPLSVQFYPFTTTTRFSSSFSISSIGALFASPSLMSSFPEKRLFGPFQSASACPMSFYLCDFCRQLPACLFEPHPPPILVVQLFPRLAAFSGTIFFTCNNLSNASSVLPVPLAPSLLWPTNDLSFCRLCCP